MNTDTAKEIAIERHEFLEKFLREFLDEGNGKNDRYRILIFKRQ